MDAAEVGEFWEANAEAWTRYPRAGYDVYRDALNTPAFLSMLPAVRGLVGLDIGCGEGSNTRRLARLGARMQAIDIAATFIRHAQAAEDADPLGIAFQVADGTDLPFPAAAFDFAVAFMSLMDMPDQRRAVQEVARVLRPGGFLQFSKGVARRRRRCVCHRDRGLLRSQRHTDRCLVVRNLATRGTRARRAVSHPSISSNVERNGWRSSARRGWSSRSSASPAPVSKWPKPSRSLRTPE